MGTPLDVVLHHPRRLGFIAFNLIVAVLLVLWVTAAPDAGLTNLPNLALANVGIVFVLTAWIVAWVAWGVMIARRRRRHRGEIAGA